MWAEINETSLSVKERLKAAVQIWSSLEAGKERGKRVGLVQWTVDLLISLYGGKGETFTVIEINFKINCFIDKKSKKIEIKR